MWLGACVHVSVYIIEGSIYNQQSVHVNHYRTILKSELSKGTSRLGSDLHLVGHPFHGTPLAFSILQQEVLHILNKLATRQN